MTCPSCRGQHVYGFLAVTGGLLCQCSDCLTITLLRQSGAVVVASGQTATMVGADYHKGAQP
jgi:hypothetical protein